jgi:predicted nucleic acid-binding protein
MCRSSTGIRPLSLSALLQDAHSDAAQRWARLDGIHLVSTLAYAEACAVLRRMERETVLSRALKRAALEALDEGPWRRTDACPDWGMLRDLAARRSLRGADLWHLGTAKALQRHLPELTLLSFDSRLRKAAKGEGLVADA